MTRSRGHGEYVITRDDVSTCSDDIDTHGDDISICSDNVCTHGDNYSTHGEDASSHDDDISTLHSYGNDVFYFLKNDDIWWWWWWWWRFNLLYYVSPLSSDGHLFQFFLYSFLYMFYPPPWTGHLVPSSWNTNTWLHYTLASLWLPLASVVCRHASELKCFLKSMGWT